MEQYNLDNIINSLKSNYAFMVSKESPFWDDYGSPAAFKTKPKDKEYLDRREHLMIYAIYFLAYFGFKSWDDLLSDKKIDITVKQLIKTYTAELQNKDIAKAISEAELKKGLLFIKALPDFIKKHSFAELMEEYAAEFKGPVNSQYSANGHVERGSSKHMVKYNHYPKRW